jgi:O-antigen polymerase
MGIYEEAVIRYEKLFEQFKNDGDFLTQYGKSLGFLKQSAKAIETLKQATRHLNTTIVCSSLGQLYEQTGNPSAAEMLYLEAWYMVPNRLYPKYQLATLYNQMGARERAYVLAKELLMMPTKVESTATKEIRSWAKELTAKNTGITTSF